MENVNCLRCRFRHEDNGNCTAVGGFCTAVPAAHCPLLREYLDTELTPEEIDMDHEAAEQLRHLCRNCDLDRLEKLAEADRAGRLVVFPCKVGDTVWAIANPWTGKLLKKPIEAYVNGMQKFSHGLYVNVLFDIKKINGTRDYEINYIGKTVFLTREEAERALEAKKDE